MLFLFLYCRGTLLGARGAYALRPIRAVSFSLNLSERSCALRSAETAASAAGTKRKGHLRFPFLFELLPFPCLLVWRRPETGDRSEKGERQSGYSCVSFSTYSQFTDSVLLHMRFNLRKGSH